MVAVSTSVKQHQLPQTNRLPLTTYHLPTMSIASILDRAVAGRRLGVDEGLRLLECNELAALGEAADAVSRRRHPESYRTYNIDRNINYTNVCTSGCRFCAFSPARRPGRLRHRPADALCEDRETIALGGDQILLQGGMHPDLTLEWYEDCSRDVKAAFPEVNVHGFSPTEVHHLSRLSGLPVGEVLGGFGRRAWAVCRAAGPRSSSIASAAK